MKQRTPRRTALAATAAVLALSTVAASCGDDDDDAGGGSTAAATDETSAGVASAADSLAGSAILTSGVWARTSPATATAGAVYLTVTNAGTTDDALVGAAVDESVAASSEIHETSATPAGTSDTAMPSAATMGDAGSATTAPMMTMQPVERIDLPAGASVELMPGGYHIMLLDLAAPLEAGSTFELTLSFEQAGDVAVTVDVADEAP